MIKIFAEGEDKQTVENWKETCGVLVLVESASEAAKLNITTLPCIVEINDSSVTKTYADSITAVLNFTNEEIAEIIAKSN
jgi:hypothetical protein